jgi:hypothetical protein
MCHQDALRKLLAALALLGKPNDVEVEVTTEGEYDADVCVKVGGHTIHVTHFHRYPGMSCYFVNWSGGGDFCCCEGTPHLEVALVNLGGNMERSVNMQFRLKKESACHWN